MITADVRIALLVFVSGTVAHWDSNVYKPDPKLDPLIDAYLDERMKFGPPHLHYFNAHYIPGLTAGKVSVRGDLMVFGNRINKRIAPAQSRIESNGDITLITSFAYKGISGKLDITGTADTKSLTGKYENFTSNAPDAVVTLLLTKNNKTTCSSRYHFLEEPKYTIPSTNKDHAPVLHLQHVLTYAMGYVYETEFSKLASHLWEKAFA